MRNIVVVLLLLGLSPLARAEWKPLGTWTIRGYCPCVRCCGKRDGRTADGTYAPGATERVLAAPREMPFGSRIWIEGVGEGIVHDRGGAVKGQRLEIFFKTHEAALRWGAEQRRVLLWVDEKK